MFTWTRKIINPLLDVVNPVEAQIMGVDGYAPTHLEFKHCFEISRLYGEFNVSTNILQIFYIFKLV
jgi:hypothetical protein